MSLTFIDLHGNMHYENVVNQTRNNFFGKRFGPSKWIGARKWRKKKTSKHEIGARTWNKNMKEQEEHEHGAIMRENNNRKEQKKENEGVIQLDDVRVK